MRQERNASFFQNRECEFFPCHASACAETFYCLFCYCPLYTLGDRCGGSFTYTQAGVKDCSACLVSHMSGGYEWVLARFPELAQLAGSQTTE